MTTVPNAGATPPAGTYTGGTPTSTAAAYGQGGTSTPTAAAYGEGAAPRRRSTETKSAVRTTEFYIYVAAVLGVLLASWLVGSNDGHNDYLRADRAWFYVVLLTVGYLVSRGLAKAGSREPYDDGSRLSR
jgi:hypothetical protein